MERKEIIQKKLIAFRCPRWKDLPDFDLYMDQVVLWITQKLEPLYFNQEKILTNSMVNNYVKNSIVDPPVKKHYTSKHLAYLMVVCILKRCYTLSEIASLIDIQAKIPGSNYKAAYDKFSTYFEIYLHEVMKKGNLDSIHSKYHSKEEELLCNVVSSIVLKIYTEYYLLDQ